jgi:phosphoglycolate phosphatase-like HAD superfamily hydrolase
MTHGEARRLFPPHPANYPTPCILVDMDGTLTDYDSRLPHILETTPPDWDKFYENQVNDPPIKAVVEIVQGLSLSYPVFICTARPDRYLEATLDWLHANAVPYYQVMMRPADQEWRDTQDLKADMVQEIQARGFTPVMAFEDHPDTVAMYDARGITTLKLKDHYGAKEV